ncbi:hypothetical protein SSYRP_v1c04850 [Spiroplasma syrphidicola EA-1]|uniref:Uncharacterized protein n=1 Tax=Spiroplasma syrphidicola EA-1 TaxID=1276229 RepID=R4U3S4_9MOLU|nr:hypothetical protein [Spiroplasma syrphidicola]AGM26077.1 hypothetical protein SSYRP_v1c04850 [Spiroplasma syrphidicola EA-1]
MLKGTNKLLINETLKNQLLDNLANLILIESADRYLDLLQKQKTDSVPEIVLSFLDGIFDFLDKDFNIIKENTNNLIKMNKKEIRHFNSAIDKSKEYKNICLMLMTVYNIFKNENLKNNIVYELYKHYELLENKNISIKKQYNNGQHQIKEISIINETNLQENLKKDVINLFKKHGKNDIYYNY